MTSPLVAGLRGNPRIVRLSASLLDRPDHSCSAFVALKARPQLRPEHSERRYPPWESFPLGVVMDALDRIEFDGIETDKAATQTLSELRSPLHPGAAAWVRSACERYLDATAWLDDALAIEGITLQPESRPRVVQSGSAAEHRMLTTWGRWYGSADGSVREFRRLRISRAGAAADPSTLASAFVAATGCRATGNVYGDVPIPVRPDEADAGRVRVIEVVLSCDDVPRVLIDASAEEVRRAYRERAQRRATDIVVGKARVAGRDCAECKLHGTCDALPYLPGLLGLADRGTHRRIWSITTGRQYQICPAQAHLRDLHVPGMADDASTAVRRGITVHQWLQNAHERDGQPPCTVADLPDPDADDLGIAGEFMTRQEYRDARLYLVQHLTVCPLRGPAITEVRPEPVVTVYDPDADVVVVANPDLIRKVDGIVVYREQKTSSKKLDLTRDEALEHFPQLALAVCLVANGAFRAHPHDDAPGAGLVELEVITPFGAEVITLDAADPATAAIARQALTSMVRDWHRDTEFRARPGRWCTMCPFLGICPDATRNNTASPIEVDGVLIDPHTGEVLNQGIKVSPRAQAVSTTIDEPDRADEPPF